MLRDRPGPLPTHPGRVLRPLTGGLRPNPVRRVSVGTNKKPTLEFFWVCFVIFITTVIPPPQLCSLQRHCRGGRFRVYARIFGKISSQKLNIGVFTHPFFLLKCQPPRLSRSMYNLRICEELSRITILGFVAGVRDTEMVVFYSRVYSVDASRAPGAVSRKDLNAAVVAAGQAVAPTVRRTHRDLKRFPTHREFYFESRRCPNVLVLVIDWIFRQDIFRHEFQFRSEH